jgi:hypothetical protein
MAMLKLVTAATGARPVLRSALLDKTEQIPLRGLDLREHERVITNQLNILLTRLPAALHEVGAKTNQVDVFSYQIGVQDQVMNGVVRAPCIGPIGIGYKKDVIVVVRFGGNVYEFPIWTAPDSMKLGLDPDAGEKPETPAIDGLAPFGANLALYVAETVSSHRVRIRANRNRDRLTIKPELLDERLNVFVGRFRNNHITHINALHQNVLKVQGDKEAAAELSSRLNASC